MKQILTPSYTNLYRTFLISLVLTSLALYGLGLKYPYFWDDAFIGMRVSKNFIEGKGLYHNWEEKVQTNTSILYPLVTAPLQALPYPYSLYSVQLVDVILLALACYFSFLLITNNKEIKWQELKKKRWYMLLALAFFYPIKFLLCSVICFGMETQLYIFMIVLTAYLYQQQKIWASFIIAGSLIYVRPEGGLLLVTVSFIYFYEQWKLNNFRAAFKKILPYALVGGLIVISYFGFVYAYYGEGMLHTMKVKKLIGQSFLGGLNTFIQSYVIPYPKSQAFINILIVVGFFLVKPAKSIIFLSTWGILYFLLFTITGAWVSAFGWYFSPILTIISFLSFFIVYKIIVDANRKDVIVLLFLCFFTFISLKEARGFVKMYMYKNSSNFLVLENSAKEFNLLTNNKNYFVTLEPLGFYSYFNPNCNFKDYPGLASIESYNIMKPRGKLVQDSLEVYHQNASHTLLMDKINSHFLIMFESEMDFVFKNSEDTTNFVKLCKLPTSKYNVIAKRSMLSDEEIAELKKRAKELGYPTE